MALWPFRRKSRKKRSRVSTTDFDESRGRAKETPAVPRSQTLPDTTMSGTVPGTIEGRKQKPSPNKLQRKPRTYSFSPGRHDSIKVARKTSTKKREPRSKYQPSQPVLTDAEKVDSGVSGALREYPFDRVPTLHNKRDGDHLPRKKSSKKRRRNDPEREAEIRAMSSFVPIRPATEDWAAGRPMKKDSKRIKTGFGLGFRASARHEWDKENRSSDISIPVAESIHSSMSTDSEHIAYKVSAFDALAPRPTLRYTIGPGYGLGSGGGDGAVIPARRSSQRGQRMLSMPIPEATLKAHKRIDDLADDLSAGDLRELMERDQRRRQRKREREATRLEQKLTRSVEKQKAEEAEARRHGKESPPNLERGVLGRESVGLGIDPASAVITSSRRRPSEKRRRSKHLERGDEISEPAAADPLAAFHRTTSIPLSPVEQQEVDDEPVTPLKSPKSRSSFLRPRFASRSKSPEESETGTKTYTDPPDSLKKGSETSSSRGPIISWTSIFRWGGLRSKRSSEGPSSFSNTSRDSMQTAHAPPVMAPTTAPIIPPRRASSGVPKRTMSRFREDLPELPLSPPDSRIQSPEAEDHNGMSLLPQTIPETSPNLNHGTTFTVPPQLSNRYDRETPTSLAEQAEQRDMEAMRQTPSTFGHPDEAPIPSPEPQSMSLASIDSEASWLSGRLSKNKNRISQQTAQISRRRDTISTESENDGNEDMSITEDDYLSRVTPMPQSERNRQSSGGGEGRPSSDAEHIQGEAHWGSIQNHHPTLVHSHTVGRMKSREGLLNSFDDPPLPEQEQEQEQEQEPEIEVIPVVAEDYDDNKDDGDMSPTGSSSSTEGEGDSEGGIQRATSINLGKGHARHISAGSARLLSIITPRSSEDMVMKSSPNPGGAESL